jgi:hypothetical protein
MVLDTHKLGWFWVVQIGSGHPQTEEMVLGMVLEGWFWTPTNRLVL